MLTLPAPPPAAAVQAILVALALCAIFAVKHFVADFLLQTNGMARGKERPRGWFLPLTAHVACHAALTLAILLAAVPRLWWLAVVDFVIHWAVDRGKTLIAQGRGWRPEQPQYWWLLGFDQLCHHLTNLVLVAAMLLW